MRVSVAPIADTRSPAAPDPSTPNLSFLKNDFAAALRSFFATVARIQADNPLGSPPQVAEAVRQGRAVAAVIGFFLKYRPYPLLEEIRRAGRVFQPPFGPLLVVDGDAVRDVLARDQEFTVEPYGAEMRKVMSPAHNGGFTTFVLSTDDTEVYEPDKRLLSTVCNRHDADRITSSIHAECVRRVGAAVARARATGTSMIDVVEAVARYVPVALVHGYLGVPVAERPGSFALTDDMLRYYGDPIDGLPDTALGRGDGVIPDERQMYLWIKAAFQHFFNNVQKDPVVAAQGFRACRQLLAYILRVVDSERQRLLNGEAVADTMLTRLLHFQLGRSTPTVGRPADLDPRLVSDLRIAEHVMGTIVGAVAGQEEATCRVIDSLIRLKDGEYGTAAPASSRTGTYADARTLAVNVMSGIGVERSRNALHRYAMEALRLQPQGEVLVRKCARDGACIADSRPIAAGTLVFVAHGSAMHDVPDAGSFVLGRPREHYLHYGWGRHTCLGQFVSPVVIVESMIALLALQDLARPEPLPGESAFPLERRFGRMQLDDHNLYATTFSLRFADSGTTQLFWPFSAAADVEVM